jgi:hypothetical protein
MKNPMDMRVQRELEKKIFGEIERGRETWASFE